MANYIKKLSMKTNNKNEYDFFNLFDRFIKETQTGKRFQKNGKRLRESSVEQYSWLRKLLYDFSKCKNFQLRIRNVSYLKKRELSAEKKYWYSFYSNFTNYLYEDLDCFDNYVGGNIKRLRAFFTYLNEEKDINTGKFYKSFYVYKEDIEIITLLPEQLNYLIHNKEFEDSLPDYLQKTKDMFVFGCTVALRVSDIFTLSQKNIEIINNNYYLKVVSKKTNTFTRINLPQYAVKIIQKYPNNKKTLFPIISNARFNKNIKLLIEKVNWTTPYPKTRTKRGIPVEIFKNVKKKTSYRFCDLITSHTMRRTAITTMLCLNMPENAVRKISGHAAGSKEFFRYVELSQKYMDEETNKVFEKLNQKELFDSKI